MKMLVKLTPGQGISVEVCLDLYDPLQNCRQNLEFMVNVNDLVHY